MDDGTTTQNRPAPRRIISSKTWDGYGYTSVADCLRLWDPRQVTASFRTGRAAGVSASNSLEDSVDNVGSYADLFHNLRSDLHHQSSGADTGHEFDTVMQLVSVGSANAHLEGRDGSQSWRYDGPVMPDLGQSGFPGPFYHGSLYGDTPDVDTSFYGPKAIKLTTPTNPVENLAVSLAELKSEGFPPSLDLDHWKSTTASARTVADKHLETQFGWLPLISDVHKTFYAIKNASRLLDQFQRDAGNSIRRRLTFPTTVTEESYPDGYSTCWAENVSPSGFASMWLGRATGGVLKETRRTQNTVTFSGAFTYFLQKDNHVLNRLKEYEQMVNHLLGTRLDAETLWNLAPWSWLSDWKANIGDNIANASKLSEDGLVLRYGYLMSETISDHTLSLHGPIPDGVGSCGPISLTFSTVRKQRVRATPYGFGLDPNGFNVRQWSILGALGITKAPGKLW